MDRCPMHSAPRYVCEWQHKENALQRQARVRLTSLTGSGTVVLPKR